MPRICTWARFEDRRGGRRFYAFNSHFDHESAEARARAAEAIAARLAVRPHKDPVFVMGDLNATEDDEVVRYLVGAAARPRSGGDPSPPAPPLADTYRVLHPKGAAGTFNGWGKDTSEKKIDYILAAPPPATEVLAATIDRTMPGSEGCSVYDVDPTYDTVSGLADGGQQGVLGSQMRCPASRCVRTTSPSRRAPRRSRTMRR